MTGATTVDFTAVVARALDVPVGEVTDAAGPPQLPSWTSMRHIQLVVALEQAYRISFDYQEIVAVRTIRQLRDVLRGKGIEV